MRGQNVANVIHHVQIELKKAGADSALKHTVIHVHRLISNPMYARFVLQAVR